MATKKKPIKKPAKAPASKEAVLLKALKAFGGDADHRGKVIEPGEEAAHEIASQVSALTTLLEANIAKGGSNE